MDTEQQIQDEVTLLELEERQLLIDRKRLELRQRLAAIQRRKQPETITLDLTNHEDEINPKQEPEKDNGPIEVQDTVAEQPISNNPTAQTAMSIVKQEREQHQYPMATAGQKVAMANFQPEQQPASDVQKDYNQAAADIETPTTTASVSQQPSDEIPRPSECNRQSEKQALSSMTTPRPDYLKRTLSLPEDQGAIRLFHPQASGPERLDAEKPATFTEAMPPKKARVLAYEVQQKAGLPAPLERRRALTTYYRHLLSLHLESLTFSGPPYAFHVRKMVDGTSRCDPRDANRQIKEAMATKRKPDKFEETMERFASSCKFWWPVCLALPRLDDQRTMIKRVVGQLIDGTFDPKEFVRDK
ncbi:hypothetical protein EDD36DRAFT_420504 [Exophiala viscosa]|uniref:Uncharacterized protein n=1 Tax=Exophiala viscosa TaxID=2486360 RepID=A0AAN6IBR2_9EURO|nr:hypothetical protein EDD36DRAFT_420504 [Exophiala viscosa]